MSWYDSENNGEIMNANELIYIRDLMTMLAHQTPLQILNVKIQTDSNHIVEILWDANYEEFQVTAVG